MELTPQEEKMLLSLAHFSIESGFRPTHKNLPSSEDFPILKTNSGAFVTITIKKKLRGCIGYVQTEDELSKTVMDAAYQAAFNDPRFEPLNEDEFPQIKLEISILSEPFPLENYEEIVIGKHGLILEDVGRKALLLPQVPIEHKMNRDQFLSALCRKAGLYEEYWKIKNLNLKAFTATVFSEEEVLK
ncbi:MAG: AmmeMemoRadiSam system protein A [Ignavibacteriae bacterium]|nr:AmmeMemoRadiSam system protein A [Ignavibacteriota bacterium]